MLVIDTPDRKRVLAPRPAAAASKPAPRGGGNVHPVQPTHVSAVSHTAAGVPASRQVETLSQSINRMFRQGYSTERVEGQVRRWHPAWSSLRIRQDVLRAGGARALPRWSAAHGAGQGRPPWQSAPYYRGQKPTIVEPTGALYKNPQWSPSTSQVAVAGLTQAQRMYLREQRRQNALKFGPDARWLVTHPEVIAAVAAAVTAGPEVDLPLVEAVGNLATLAASGRAVMSGHYVEAVLDAASVGLVRDATVATRAMVGEERLAARSGQDVHDLQEAIRSHPSGISSGFLQRNLNEAIATQNTARRLAGEYRRVASSERALVALLSQLALLPPSR